MKYIHACTAAAVIVAGAMLPSESQAQFLDQYTSAPGICQAALPAYEGQIRKRPLAVQNEGTTNAFVSCAPAQFLELYDPDFGVRVLLVNNNAAPATIQCTGVAGVFASSADYYPKTVVVPGNGTGALNFSETTDSSASGSISCNLPAGTGIAGMSAFALEATTPPAE